MNRSTVEVQGMAGLSPVARETAQDMVYGQLRRALICGEFDAGVLFKAGELAEKMSVSSMPVREALARLVSERALEAMPNRRVRVPLLSRERARDVFNARKLIEGELASCALENISGIDTKYLEELIREYEDAQNETQIALANHAFHFTIYERATSAVLIPFAESLWMQAGPFVRAAARLHTPLLDTSATLHHHSMLEAIKQRDHAALRESLLADISQAFNILERCSDSEWNTVLESSNG